jgi:glycosyltransferase involved in cell wall biosynthesis
METLTFLFTTSFYPPYHVGGACVHVKYLAEELARRGHNVHVIHSMDTYRVKRGNHLPAQMEQHYPNLHVHSLSSPLRNLDPQIVYTLGGSSYVRKKFSEIVKKTHPDVVHHHNISLLGYNILNKVSDYISLYTAHDFWLVCQTSNLLRNGNRICNKKFCFPCAIKSMRPPQIWRAFRSYRTALRNIDLMIVPCEYVQRRIAQEIEMKSIVIRNFVPAPPPGIVPVADSNYFLFVGMLEVHKGILNLIEIFRVLRNKLKSKLIIVGDGSLKNCIKSYIKRNALRKLISYRGFVDTDQLYSLYKGALAVIVPSIWPENAPLVALESFSVGTPVIASNTGGLPEIVGKLGKELLFSNQVELRNLLLNFPRNKFSPNKIVSVYEKYFSPDVYIRRYIRTIDDIRAQDSKIACCYDKRTS